MLACGWAMSWITATGIRMAVPNISITAVIGRLPATHLPAQEHGNADHERTAHDQRRRQRLKIGEHAGRLPRSLGH
jgi:hypothetical protein